MLEETKECIARRNVQSVAVGRPGIWQLALQSAPAQQSKLIPCRLFSPFPIPCRHDTRSRSHSHCSEWSECSLVRERTMGIGSAQRGRERGRRGSREGELRRRRKERRSSFAINTFHVQLQSVAVVRVSSHSFQFRLCNPESMEGMGSVDRGRAGWRTARPRLARWPWAGALILAPLGPISLKAKGGMKPARRGRR